MSNVSPSIPPIQGATITLGESYAGEAEMAPALTSTASRPILVRRETDQILSYYQSEHAGQTLDYASAALDCESQPSQAATTSVRPRAHRKDSTFTVESDYSSQYSTSDDISAPAPAAASGTTVTTAPAQDSTPRTDADRHPRSNKQAESGDGDAARHSRRVSVPSEGGADRRRLAIVEMDSHTAAPPLSMGRKRSKGGLDHEGNFKSSSSASAPANAMSIGTLFSRRGVHIGGLALVAPADASPGTYTDLTPPSTAPVSTSAGGSTARPPSAFFPTHTRSASEAIDSSRGRSRLNHKSSRDVGIVGLSGISSPISSAASESLGPASPTSDEYHVYAQSAGLGVPLFQTPAKSRSPSPGATTPELSDTSSASAFRSPHQRLLSTPIFGMEDGAITPSIGEGKDIQRPVAGPVIVELSAGMLRGHGQGAHGVAAREPPVVQSPASSSSSPSYGSPTSSSPSVYLHYQPGVHATAGPLPPPPRSIFDRDTPSAAPPRPPRYHTPLSSNTRRDIDAIKEALQLPQSVSAKLAARTPPQPEKREASPTRPDGDTRSQESAYSEDEQPSIKLLPSTPVHVREGAFPPSKIMSSPPDKTLMEPASTVAEEPTSDRYPSVVVEQEGEEEDDRRKGIERRPGLELRRENSWVSVNQENTKRDTSPNGKALPAVSVSRTPSSISTTSSSSSVSQLPSLPPKSIRHGSDDEKPSTSLAPSAFRALTNINLKRFSSLPRTPSRSSKSSKHSSSPDPHRSLSPPPPIHVQPPPRRRIPPKPKYAHPWPPAMNAADVTVLRSARERARGYATKINELSMYDCGLREWMASQGRGPVSHPRTQSQRTARTTMHPVPIEFGGQPSQPRHISHGSMASNSTFPIRADAYMATDLSTRPIDVLPTSAPPPILPYPSLAQAQLQRAPARSSTLILSPTKSLQIPLPGSKGTGTGFFASLGRKTSIRRDKGSLLSSSSSPQSPNKILTKQRPQQIAASQSNPPPSRPAPQPAAPTIPGGPRAAPGRIQRSKTYSVGPVSPASPPEPSPPQISLSAIQPESSQSAQSSANNNQRRQSTVPARRPSLFARARPGHASVAPMGSRAANAAAAGAADPSFERQVDKLADLLPHADRAVLAGYMRRAGEDILAIGQYLEDEKNGKLRRD